MSSRYRETRDMFQLLLALEKRISNLERSGQVGNTSIDRGEFTVAGGDIVVLDDSGIEVMRIISGATPKIKMTPLGDSSEHHIEIQGKDFVGNTAMQSSIEKTGIDTDGGKVLLWNESAVLSHQPSASGGLEAYIALGQWPFITTDGQAIYMQGRFLSESSLSDNDALYMGSIDVGAGFGGLSYTYPTTYIGKMVPIVSLKSGSVIQWCLTAQDNDGFTVSWSDTTAKVVNFICIRLNS